MFKIRSKTIDDQVYINCMMLAFAVRNHLVLIVTTLWGFKQGFIVLLTNSG